MHKVELLQLAIYKRDQAARFRKVVPGLSLNTDRETMKQYVADLEHEANQLEAQAEAMDVRQLT